MAERSLSRASAMKSPGFITVANLDEVLELKPDLSRLNPVIEEVMSVMGAAQHKHKMLLCTY